jgi:tRNA nucleotidyltransferase/poly(A) polymerase
MNLKDILNTITSISKSIGASEPYICGGLPRDKVMNRDVVIDDIDITNGDSSIKDIANAVALNFKSNNSVFKKLPGSHSQLFVKFDFSTNYIQPGVKEMLEKAGMKQPTPMQQELYSRDFTCNALLMTMDLKKVIDPTGLGFSDIKEKVLRTCLPAQITLGYDNKRVDRIIYMAAKLGFKVDDEIIKWVKNNPQSLLANGNVNYVSKKINKALDYNDKITIKLIGDMGLWPYIPVTDKIIPYMSKG